MKINYTGITDSRTAYIASKLLEKRPGQGLIICAGPARARRIAGDLSFFSRAKVSVLPDQDAAGLRYDAKSTADLAERLRALDSLCTDENAVIVAPVLGALKKLPPPEEYLRNVFELKLGGRMERDELERRLSSMGYERVPSAEAPGQFAVRGDIIDIFCPGQERPVRAEFFDDELDSLRSYDPITQRSVENIESFTVFPAELLSGSPEAFDRGLKGVMSAYAGALSRRVTEEGAEKLRRQRDYLIDLIEEKMNRQYLEAFISYFYEQPALIWDYMKDPSFIIIDDPTGIGEVTDFYLAEEDENRKALLGNWLAVPEDFASSPDPYDLVKLVKGFDRADIVFTTPFTQQIRLADSLDELVDTGARQAPVFSGHMEMLASELRRYISDGYRVLIACQTSERNDNLKEFLGREGLLSSCELRMGTLGAGMDLPKEKLLILSESEIFPAAKRRRSSRRGRNAAIKAFTDVNKGDYVVHENHGIGRFEGVEKLEIEGSVRDYLKIQYAGQDVLYVPVDQLESIQKYVGSEGAAPKINRLSGNDWQVTKERTKAAIRDMAEDLLKISAQRSLGNGYQFGPDSAWQKEFEDSFPFEETEDQLRCTEEIKKDMESSKVMDRLLCGDVGYGKTEVAARAVFKCLEEGRQAAILVPTTVLANQHFHSFTERFKGYPFIIEMFSRFRSEQQQAEIVKKLATGEIDLIIGTHRLLSSDVKFKDLGLLVIDEEQRFGVEHKEKIKQIKTNVDVLTLSATPIPRTLHMSLIGVRDMSVIEEPPEDRYPVQTYVLEQDDRMLADVIRRELGRDGQVYIVYNRVRGIQTLARHIQELVPEAKISVGHGQMNERQLEDVMLEFTRGETQILISTTIIESGIDIPNVNTIIIMDADRFGLSQLYQLRGRVGRSNRMAYAYLIYKKDKVLSEQAESRLRAIKEFTEFGSGFRVAMRDLELRGAGNLLGVEQSGHMVDVGYELYCKLVDEAVRELGGRAEEEEQISSDTAVEVAVRAYLPERYIQDEMTRLAMYKRIASIQSFEDRLEVTDELLDRFGDLPIEADNLMDVALVRNRASRCGINKVVSQKDRLVFIFDDKNLLTPEAFARLMDDFGLRLTIYGGSVPRISLSSGKAPLLSDALALVDCILGQAA